MLSENSMKRQLYFMKKFNLALNLGRKFLTVFTAIRELIPKSTLIIKLILTTTFYTNYFNRNRFLKYLKKTNTFYTVGKP